MKPILAVVSDFSRVILFPKDEKYTGSLNELHKELTKQDTAYDFESYFTLNTELLAFYREICSRVPVSIFTSDLIQEHPAIKDEVYKAVKGVFSANRMQVRKDEPESYLTLANLLRVSPENILYIDDQQINIDVATKAGYKTLLYTDNTATKSGIEKCLSLY